MGELPQEQEIVKGRNCDENAIIGKRIMFSTNDTGVLDKLYSVDGTANELNWDATKRGAFVKSLWGVWWREEN